MIDQGIYMLQRPLFGRRSGQGMVRLKRALGHVIHALLYDAQALADLFNPNHGSVIGIAVGPYRDLKLEIFITGIGPPFS